MTRTGLPGRTAWEWGTKETSQKEGKLFEQAPHARSSSQGPSLKGVPLERKGPDQRGNGNGASGNPQVRVQLTSSTYGGLGI